MIKKNLIILLLIPFLIALIGAAAVKTTYKMIENDIIDIKWKYDDTEAFKINEKILLEATYVAEKDYEISPGNELVWTIINKDSSDSETHATIVEDDDKYYLNTLSIGDCIITCSNKKGNVSKSMNAIIYEYGAITINPEIKGSQANINNTIYYGEYDFDTQNKKKKAEFNLNIKVVPEDYKDHLCIVDMTDNINFDLKSGSIQILNDGDAYIKVGIDSEVPIDNQSYNFNIVKDGINVYSYDDLLNCTNKSKDGEIAVLRKSFESLSTYTLLSEDNNNVELFGNYNSSSKKFNFANEIYNFETTYNHEFIDKWNGNCDNVSGETKISSLVKAGLRVQKDLYGNGYTINMHNLTYPTETSEIELSDGTKMIIPVLAESDLYRGPLPFYSLGNHNNMPLIEAFGQDNVGMYVDGNNITINDINMKNCDFSNSLGFLDYVGTVMDIHGNNNTIIYSRISNGKNVIRAFSTENLLIKNSLISNARNFLLYAGSNEYTKPNETKEYDFLLADGSKITSTIPEFFKKNGYGDALLTNYCSGTFDDPQTMYLALQSCQKALCDTSGLYDSNNNLIYKGEINVTDTFFYRSGVSSIGLDSMFDGEYLYSSIPSVINDYLKDIDTQAGNKMSDLLTSNTGGQAFPIKLNINGKTRFYDYKETDNIDISGLIHENMNSFAQVVADAHNINISGLNLDIGIDHIFPIKKKIVDSAQAQGSIYEFEGKKYVNCVIAYYGGGYNYSKITVDGSEIETNINKEIKIDVVSDYVRLESTSQASTLVKYLMQKAVTATIGTNPFKFVCIKNNGYLFGETPNIQDLKNN